MISCSVENGNEQYMENRFMGGRERLQERMYINEEEKDT
jgi:hypothetical protein